MPTDGCARFSGVKTPVFFTMERKRKPSETLGNVIRILMIIKLALAILHQMMT
jgi:hypothetical protein